MYRRKNQKRYDLEDRTLEFTKDVRASAKKVPKSLTVQGDLRQLLDASGSVGANYIEANEALSKKDFCFRIKICRKESKESRFWLRVLDIDGQVELLSERDRLIQESTELMCIFGAILQRSAP